MTIFGITVSMIIVWLVLMLVLLIVEALTAGLTTIWFAAGALVALICALLDLSVTVQVVIFFAASILLLVFTRKIFVEKLKTGIEKTNVDALIGEKGIVISPVPAFGMGQVKVNGQIWSAVGKTDDVVLKEGQTVKIQAVQGVKLIVTPVKDA